MTDEVAKVALVYEARGAEEGSARFVASSKRIIDAANFTGAAGMAAADKIETATTRVAGESLKQARSFDTLARRIDPLGQAVRDATRDMDRLAVASAGTGQSAVRAAELMGAAQARVTASLQAQSATVTQINPLLNAFGGEMSRASAAATALKAKIDPISAAYAENGARLRDLATLSQLGLISDKQRVAILDQESTALRRKIAELDGSAKAAREAAAAEAQMAVQAKAFIAAANPAAASAARLAEQRAHADKLLSAGLITSAQHGAGLRALSQQTVELTGKTTAATESASRFSQVMARIGNASGGGLGAAFATGGAIGLGIAAASAAAAALAAVIKSIPAAGDAARQSIARLSATIGDTRLAADAFERLQALSAQTGVAVADAAGAFQRFGIAARDVGATNSQVLDLVSGLQKFAIVSGATTAETQSATTQLAQGLASGKLQGDELRSILESMPLFASALARELGTSVGGLRAMGTEGKLSSDVIFPAILRTVEGIDDVFGRMPVTLARATQQFTSASDALLARMDDALGISAKLISAFQTAANLANSIRRGIGGSTNVEREAELIAKFAARQAEVQAYNAAIGDAQAAKADSQSVAILERNRQTLISEAEKTRKELLAINNQRVLDDEAAEAAAGEARLSAATDNSTKEIAELRKKNDKKFTAQEQYNEDIKKLNAARDLGAVGDADYVALQAALQATLDEALKKGTETRTAHTRAAAAAVPVQKELADTFQIAIDAANQDVAAQRRLLAAYDGTSKSLVTARNHNRAYAEVLKTVNVEHADFTGKVAKLAAEFDDASEAAGRLEHAEQSVQAVSNILESAFDRLGQGLVDAFLSGKDAAINFGSVARAIAASLLSDFAKLAIIIPIKNAIFGTNAGTLSGAISAFGGGSSGQTGGTSGGGIMGNLSNASSLAGLSDALGITSIKDTLLGWGNSLGITGNGGLMGGLNSLLSTTVFHGPAGSLAASAGAEFGIGAAASAGAPISLGSVLGGIGAGFGIGSFGGGLLQGSLGKTGPAPTIGAGVGSVAGALIGSIIPGIGTLLGGLIGGSLGGGAGGLIGPQKASSFSSTGLGISATGGLDIGQTVSQIADTTAELAQLQAQVSQINQLLAASGAVITSLGGVSQIGQNTPGGFQDPSKAAGLDAAFSGLRFSAPGNDILNRQISDRSFASAQELAAATQEVKNFVDVVVPALKRLGEPDSFGIGTLSAGLEEIKAQFVGAIATAQKLGYAENDLVAARERALTVAQSNALQALKDIDAGLSQRQMNATAIITGKPEDAMAAALAAFDAAADAQRKQLNDSLLSLLGDTGKTHVLYTDRMVLLEKTLGEERLAVSKQYNDAITAALQKSAAQFKALDESLAVRRSNAEAARIKNPDQINIANLFAFDVAAAVEREVLHNSLADALGAAAGNTQAYADQMALLLETQVAERNLLVAQQSDANLARAAQMQDLRTGLLAREAGAANDNTGLQLQLFYTNANAEVEAFRAQIIALGASGAEVADTLARLIAVQATERQAIIDQAAAIEMQRTDSAAGTASGVIRSITDYARGLQFGSESPLSATSQLNAATMQFDAVRGAAAAGDFNSAQQLTGFAETLRTAARNVFGSGVGYVDVIKKITDALEPISTMAPERLITSVMTTEIRSQTQTLSADLMELKTAINQVRDSIRAGSGAPPASRAA